MHSTDQPGIDSRPGTPSGTGNYGSTTTTGTRTSEQQARDTATAAKAEAHQTKEELKQGARDVADQARQQFDRATQEAKARGEQAFDQGKSNVADEVSGVADTLRQTARGFEEHDDRMLAGYASQAADSIGRFADSIRTSNMENVVSQVEDFARRQPGLFLGATVAAGFMLARFLKSSSHHTERDYYGSYSGGYGRGYDRGPDYPMVPRYADSPYDAYDPVLDSQPGVTSPYYDDYSAPAGYGTPGSSPTADYGSATPDYDVSSVNPPHSPSTGNTTTTPGTTSTGSVTSAADTGYGTTAPATDYPTGSAGSAVNLPKSDPATPSQLDEPAETDINKPRRGEY